MKLSHYPPLASVCQGVSSYVTPEKSSYGSVHIILSESRGLPYSVLALLLSYEGLSSVQQLFNQ